jgi:hypothetical protein
MKRFSTFFRFQMQMQPGTSSKTQKVCGRDVFILHPSSFRRKENNNGNRKETASEKAMGATATAGFGAQ